MSDRRRRPPPDADSTLFEASMTQPLAARMRPRSLDEFIGQRHLLDRGKPLRESIEKGTVGSMIFWGPPGTGKTTLARLIARYADREFVPFSAVTHAQAKSLIGSGLLKSSAPLPFASTCKMPMKTRSLGRVSHT